MIDASLIVWESGTDLVIDTEVDASPAEVWRRIADSDECAEWFAPFTRVDDDRVRFRLDDGEDVAGPDSPGSSPGSGTPGTDRSGVGSTGSGTPGSDSAGTYGADEAGPADPEAGGSLEAEVLSCEEDSHVLLEFAALGRLGISLQPTNDGTRISLTCTFATAEEAAEILPEVGPVWETHLRLLREAVGAGASDVPESELTARYEQLAAQAQDDSDSNDPEDTDRPGEESTGIDYGSHDFGSHDPGVPGAPERRPGGDGPHDR
ncbi:hypothetical protein [uncultured Brevibacterium sp.]|uniref:SRPBCC family protein n=1 Tax=uncultured Brevibacterium sp. TaxID=189678 RepID=UPI0025D18BA8|nr:hypothetical protein [uncultured Brevibacterium sp.]